MRSSSYQKILGIVTLILAVLLLLIGNLRYHKVHDQDTTDFGIQAFHRISELQLVVDATFSGTIRKGQKLYSTYERSQPVGKRPCPT